MTYETEDGLTRFLACAGLALGLAGVVALPQAAAGHGGVAPLQPHRALYEVELAAADRGRAVSEVDGFIEFRLEDACLGWTVRHRAVLEMGFGERGGSDLAWRYSAWESAAGDRLRFALQRYRDGTRTEALRGDARLRPEGGGTARVNPEHRPEAAREIELPADTLFPAAHTRELTQRLAAGDAMLVRHVFDGTGQDEGLHMVSSLRLDETTGQAPEFDSPLLAEMASWRVTTAYFDPFERAGTPAVEETGRIYANGITGDMRIDFGGFAVDATLSELEALDRPMC